MRRSCLGALLVPLVVLLVTVLLLALGADRGSVWLLDRAVAHEVEGYGGHDVSVKTGGFPFLTQALRRRFDHVEVRAGSLERDGLTTRDVHLDLRDVHPTSPRAVDVGRLDGSVRVPYSELETLAKLPSGALSSSGGALVVHRTVPVAGRQTDVQGTVSLRASGTHVVLVPRGVRVVGGAALPAATLGKVRGLLGGSYAVPGLPAGVRLTKVTPGANGVVLTVSGTDLHLSR
ncbi:DUF2993 family protein [Motilibacter rhizosphaerae]|uniref:DUF2993 family protein n=1 Tax=Motilibacter rhizosphaerae TaxID=598652 RepID=A0A4Q7NUD5_9ACTN|nr:DUF2993 domain-containing protein [Motilibacter rhizosphaerae]RZS90777.1 DUF2993 family protein [Motilibacter rhizosphaerae]